MILLQVNQLTKRFGAEAILENIQLEIKTNDRIALVGKNGAGKSTLLKIIANQLSYDEGQISKPKDVTIGYLAQNTGLESTRTIWDEMLSVFEPLKVMEQRIRTLEEQLAQPNVYENEERYQQVSAQYDHLQHEFKEKGGYQYESDIRSILHGFRFYEERYQQVITSLSGGQKTRLALAKLLLSNNDILILDEPTNHLDIETLTWLENYLANYRGALLIVSHDRYFLDRVVNQVYSISRTHSKHYVGNYSHYLTQYAADLEKEWKQFDKQQGQIAKLEDFVQRNIVRASTTKRAQARRKQLEKIDRIDKPLGDEKAAHFSFKINKPSGKDALLTTDLGIGYDAPLAQHLNIDIKRTDAIALVGPNGVGKSTLLKTLIKQLPALSGTFTFGANTEIGYYDQELSNLNSRQTVLEELWSAYPSLDEKIIRTLLGSFLFTGDDVKKAVNMLSGGEKARLALSKLTLQQANFLILDEPTNHLDIDSKEVLENALIDYEGTLLFVSHDRYFINRIANKVIELSADGAVTYLGDYDYYVEKLAIQTERAALLAAEKTPETLSTVVNDRKLSYAEEKAAVQQARKQQRAVEAVEREISETETLIDTLEHRLADPAIFGDVTQTQKYHQQLLDAQAALEQLMIDWEHLSS
ncbi:ABC-F family ATP-binding cassette domain-containing protein [Brochothrix campestris]